MRRPGRLARGLLSHLAVVAAFALPAVALWWHAWDGHLTTTVTCACGDAGQEVWFMAWPAYALPHGLDPFFSRWLYPPGGVNLLANTSAPLVGTVLAPVTWLAGPVAATTVALTLCPALSAWGCWVAGRRWTAWRPAAWVAGLLYGYSPYEVTNLTAGHVSISLLVVPPLLLVACYDLVVARRGRPVRTGAAIGLLAAAQLLISPEVLAVTAVMGVAGALLLVLLRPGMLLAGGVLRAGRRALARGAGAAVAVGAVLLAWPAWFLLRGPRHIVGPPWTGLAVLIAGNQPFAFWDPGDYRAPANTLTQLSGYLGRSGPPPEYVGWAVLVLAGAALAVAWRRRLAWWAALMAVVAGVLSLGTLLWTSPNHLSPLWLPWRALDKLPLLGDLLPQRFSVYVDLCLALLVAVGLDAARQRVAAWQRAAGAAGGRRRARRRVLVAAGAGLLAAGAVAVAFTWWTYQAPFTTRTVAVPAWFRTVGRQVPEGSVVLTIPFPFPSAATSAPMVWQAVDGMRFRLAGGYAKAPAADGKPLSNRPGQPPFGTLDALSEPFLGPVPAGTPAQIRSVRSALRRWDVAYVVVTRTVPDPAAAVSFFTAAVGRLPIRSHGAWVWDLRRHPAPSASAPVDRASAALRSCAAVASRPGRGPSCVAAALAAG